ncbi:MAG TPA: HAMP domain-containing protein, partial [Kofleriaceae bacterium]|nr:HAMP domain-containing protein [Kofleriaceae bacterium]
MARSRMSIRTRLTLIIMGVTLGCLGLGFTLVALRQVDSLRDQRLAAMSVMAETTGDAAVSSLSFKDAADGHDVLARLKTFGDVEAAALYDEKGELFASYKHEGALGAAQWPARLSADAGVERRIDGDAIVQLPIVYENQRYGTIWIASSTDALSKEIDSFLVTLLTIGALLVILSGVFATLLGRRITRPILSLADVARRITKGSDTSLRAPVVPGPGEIATLASGFNAMLAKLEQREQEVVSSRDTIRAVIDSSPVAIIGIQKDGTVGLWSAAATALFSTTEVDAIGKPIAAVAPDPAVMALTRLWARAASEPVGSIEVELTDGLCLAMQAAPLPGGGVVVAVADVTERRRAAEALAERAQQLQRVQKMEVVGRLAGGVAHDFNHLITVVMAAAQMLQWRTAGRGDVRGYVDNIVDAAQRGAALSRRLLAFSRQQAVDAKAVDTRAVL